MSEMSDKSEKSDTPNIDNIDNIHEKLFEMSDEELFSKQTDELFSKLTDEDRQHLEYRRLRVAERKENNAVRLEDLPPELAGAIRKAERAGYTWYQYTPFHLPSEKKPKPKITLERSFDQCGRVRLHTISVYPRDPAAPGQIFDQMVDGEPVRYIVECPGCDQPIYVNAKWGLKPGDTIWVDSQCGGCSEYGNDAKGNVEIIMVHPVPKSDPACGPLGRVDEESRRQTAGARWGIW